MNELGLSQEGASIARGAWSFSRRQLPYIIVLMLAISGVAYTNISHQPPIGYWEFLTLALGALSVVSEWPKADDRRARVQLILKQALHWGAILIAMNIMLLTGAQQLLPSPAMSLVLLILLALGTFLAGLNLQSVQLCFLGAAMALAVPAIAWFKQSALFLLLAVVLLVGLGLAFWPRRGDSERAAKSGDQGRSIDGAG
jgi:hypothetical protein